MGGAQEGNRASKGKGPGALRSHIVGMGVGEEVGRLLLASWWLCPRREFPALGLRIMV